MNLPLPTGEVDFVVEFTKLTKSGEGSIFKMLNRAKKKCAFTLSEVLIVLAVLGVVAAMTIPNLIQKYQEKALITALKKSYTVFSQAVDMAIAENGSPNTWELSSDSDLYNILRPYLRGVKDCGSSYKKACWAEHYEALFSTTASSQPGSTGAYAKGILASGTSFLTWTRGCNSIYCGHISVDVNGQSGPNKTGVDYFSFWLSPEGLQPFGGTYYDSSMRCEYNNTSVYNGRGCTYWALKHENMDYLRKSGCYYGPSLCK